MHRIRGFFVVALLCSAVLWSTSTAQAQIPPTPSTWGTIKAMYGISDKSGDPQLAIGSRRYWVRNECWYALNQAWLTKGDDPNGPSNTMSNWNWLSTTADAGSNGLRYALNTYQTCVSNLIPPVCNCCPIANSTPPMQYPKNTVEYWVGELSSDTYGKYYHTALPIGHGCQCVSFVGMVIYRAMGGSSKLSWSWSSSPKSSDPSAINAQPGDLVYRNSGGIQHLAICVKNYGSGITLVDSNFLGDEVIGRHDLSSGTIGSTWKMQSGSGRWY